MVRKALADKGIATQIHYEIPLHLEPAFASLGYRRGMLPNAEQVTAEILSLPMYPELTGQHIEEITSLIADAIGRG